MSTVLALFGLLVGLGVLGVVGDMLYRIMRPLGEITRNVDDTLEAVRGIERNLGDADELERTRRLVSALEGHSRPLADKVRA